MEEGNTNTVAEEIVKLVSWGYWEGSNDEDFKQ